MRLPRTRPAPPRLPEQRIPAPAGASGRARRGSTLPGGRPLDAGGGEAPPCWSPLGLSAELRPAGSVSRATVGSL
eukprot:4613136-Alexandrium_andersonii.AAC.1